MENKRLYCWKRDIDLEAILSPELTGLAEQCTEYDEDERLSRVHFPIGVTRQKAAEDRKAAMLKALEEVDDDEQDT